MTLQLVVDSIDTVAEPLRALYVEKDGKHHLQVDGIEDTTGLKNALAAERNANKTVKEKIAAYEKLGKTAEQIDEMLAAERTKAEEALKKAGKFDEVLATHLGKAKQERDEAVGAATKQRDSALNIARKAIVDTKVGGALAKAKATAAGLDLLSERLGKRVSLEFGEDGRETISILDADGKTPMVGSGAGGLATFDDLVKEAIKGYPDLFEGTGGGGSGMDPKSARRDAGGKIITRKDFDALSPADRSAKMKAGFTLVD
jgi:hypothetical protein